MYIVYWYTTSHHYSSGRGTHAANSVGAMLCEVLPLAGAEMASAADVRGTSAEAGARASMHTPS